MGHARAAGAVDRVDGWMDGFARVHFLGYSAKRSLPWFLNIPQEGASVAPWEPRGENSRGRPPQQLMAWRPRRGEAGLYPHKHGVRTSA